MNCAKSGSAIGALNCACEGILRTGCLMHFDLACSALDEAGVPYPCGEETSGGLRVALPAMPTPGPGTWWSVRVPTSFAEQAEELIETLPFERTLASQ